MSNSITKKEVSRRSFIGAAAVATLGLGLTACSSSNQAQATNESQEQSSAATLNWAGEADVIVMGFGGAGGTAAIEAARQGASVLLFEKAPEQFAGGNSSVCEGVSLIAGNRQEAFDTYRRLIDVSSVSDAEINSALDDNENMIGWFKEAIGFECNVLDRKASSQWGSIEVGDGFPTVTINPTFFSAVSNGVKKMSDSINVLYETPVTGLVQDNQTGEIHGVTVTTSQGETKNYKAKRGVVLACGGFENNPYLIEQFCYDPLPQPGLFPMGTPYNTGDGIQIVSKVGAKLRHLASVEFGAYCFLKPTEELGATIAMKNDYDDLDHLIAVNKKGVRFMDEAFRTQSGANPHPCHEKATMKELDYDGIAFEYSNYPFWFVFDDTRRASHALGSWAGSKATSGWVNRRGLYLWSDDNQAEIDKGWLIKADTIAELAGKIGLDPETLENTVETYNAACASGTDLEFGRKERLTPIETGPFYASEMGLAFINTQGGAARNENYEVIDWNDQPIPRLFAAGEFGSIWGHNYHAGNNVPEASCGFAAGGRAAKLDPWE